MQSAGTHTQLSVVSSGCKGKELHFQGEALPDAACQQSQTLLDLLETDGAVTLPILPSHFQAWVQYVASCNGTTPSINNQAQTNSLASKAELIEVSLFLRSAETEAHASSCVAKGLRRAYREDLLQTETAVAAAVGIFPHTVLPRPGEILQAAIAALPPLSSAAAAAVVPHLTLCEALILSPPFPAEALAHFLSLTAGVLDLSPPRVPVHTPATLLDISRLVAGILPAAPPLTALRIPAPCLDQHQPLHTIRPLLQHLSTLTSLCITHGKASYGDLRRPCATTPAAVAAVLEQLSPAALRHLSIDTLVDPNEEPMHSVLCTFTALTSLRLPTAPLAIAHMPAVESLFLTHLPTTGSALEAQGQLLREAPSLRRIHASGDNAPTVRVYQSASGHFNLDHPVPATGRALPPIITRMCRPLNCTAFDVDGEDLDRGVVHCCGHIPSACGMFSLQAELSLSCAVASSYVHFFRYGFVTRVLGPDAAAGAGGSCAAPDPRDDGGPGSLRALALGGDVTGVSAGVLALTRRILTGAVPHHLGTLCVLRVRDLPPRSALWIGSVFTQDVTGGSAGRPQAGGYRCGWVTARPSGVAHPLCALEMLHYNAAPHGDADTQSGSAWPRDPAPEGWGLHTLHLSRDAFAELQDLILSDAPCMVALRDIAALGRGHKDLGPTSVPDFACLSRLTNLRTLSLQGVGGVLCAPECLSLPRGLTALLLHGDHRHRIDFGGQWRGAAEFGKALLQMPGLQCLDVEVELLRRWGISPQPAVVEDACRQLWEGLRPALLELPLHLGARAVCK